MRKTEARCYQGEEDSGQFDPRARDNSQVMLEVGNPDDEFNQYYRTLVESGMSPIVVDKLLEKWQRNARTLEISVSDDGVVHELFK